MNEGEVQYRFMQLDDLDGVMDVEKNCFPSPWSRTAFENELLKNRFAYYIVAEVDRQMVGYCGVWLIVDEAHITNIAVAPAYRGRKIGRGLMQVMMGFSYQQGAKKMTLEVRPSNHLAQHMYEKLGFTYAGRRKGYYTDNGEDAIIMWADLHDSVQL